MHWYFGMEQILHYFQNDLFLTSYLGGYLAYNNLIYIYIYIYGLSYYSSKFF